MVFNARAAVGRAARLLPRLRFAFGGFADLELLETGDGADAAARIAAADLSGFDGLVAVGGDGTLFHALNGLYARPPAQRVPLAVVPVGTGNAFARDLGLAPGDWRRAAELVRGGRLRRVDVGRVEHGAGSAAAGSYHFLNIVGAGLPVDAMRTAEHLKFFGRSAYSLAALWRALRLQTYPMRLELDGETLEQEALFVELSNSRYTGTSFLMAPTARFDDGLFDLTLLRRLPRRRLLRLFPTIYSGRHVDYPEVFTRRVRELRIRAPEGLQLAPDGEFRGCTPATIRCLERDLEIFA